MKLGLALTVIGSISLTYPGVASAQTLTSGRLTIPGPDSAPAGVGALINLTYTNDTGATLFNQNVGFNFDTTNVQNWDLVSPPAGAICGRNGALGHLAFPAWAFPSLPPGASITVSVNIVPNGNGPIAIGGGVLDSKPNMVSG